MATSSRISLRTSPCAIARQRVDDLQMLGPPWCRGSRAVRGRWRCLRRKHRGRCRRGGREMATMATSRTCGCVRSRAAICRRLAHETQAAALAIGDIEPAGDGVIDLLAGRHPCPGDKTLAREHAALGGGERLGRVAALVLQKMPQILVARRCGTAGCAAEAGGELKIGEIGAAVGRRASSVPWRGRCGLFRRDAACATPPWRSGNSRRRHAAWRYAAARRRSSRAPAHVRPANNKRRRDAEPAGSGERAAFAPEQHGRARPRLHHGT